ncbi:trehalose import ATP-binding protein SugC [Variibacter gotjawalensis]|uniref:Trehalose import ATP-binding protein SugC n=1 Tax=Variibacter gotjawalensis TaxID=1333996 RepID=A0A0S3PTE9_9BRAD|nr:ABC transporter ATP-binding protein [Variibacter gotjawalensis]NIK49417.1 multiple sugar transport system ATP-binding protein [Variibacter gotjawalensis]RZS51269.1 carbohydrate ABC transporter ATP-binding protein (CUT1 family) [Variibacter gotjawalensis]BAT59102.1 trehalose import ATP-binding protein SugC [Variibacter gotjawalensis]
MAGITAHEVTKSFGDTPVLDRVSVDIRDGEFLTLVGPSGCGKTTLLRIIAGLESQDSGDVAIGGVNVDTLRPKDRDVAMVFQSYALYPYMTVAQNVALPLTMRRMSFAQRLPLVGRFVPGSRQARAGIDADVAAVSEALGIKHLGGRRPAQLSGGQRQRVALARAMVRNPKAFLMDEPLSNLDAKLRVQARAEIAELHRKLGTTFVYVTHDQVEAMTMSDRVAVMLGGKLLQIGPPQQIYDSPATLEVARFVGTPEINLLPARVRDDNSLEIFGHRWFGFAEGAAAGEATIGIRPESWSIGGGHRALSLTGVVQHREMLGSETLVHVRVAEAAKPIIARVDPRTGAGFVIGASVTLSVESEHILIFDRDGKRLAVPVRTPHLSEVCNG